jgi:hypothetical protein
LKVHVAESVYADKNGTWIFFFVLTTLSTLKIILSISTTFDPC